MSFTIELPKGTARQDRGMALVAVLMMLIVVSSMMTGLMIMTRTQLASVKASRDSSTGYNVAESGLNLRAQAIREIFDNFEFPTGTSPSGVADCASGSGSFACQTFTFDQGRSATTFVTPDASNPHDLTIPPGEPYNGLFAREFRYTVSSVAQNASAETEAILGLTFKTRMIPLFQFAVFFQEDLEFFNGATMSIDGPVHTNGEAYLGVQTNGQLNLGGVVSSAGAMFRGLKAVSSCSGYNGVARVRDPVNLVDLNSCSSDRAQITDVAAWNGNLLSGVPPLNAPPVQDLQSFSNGPYWQRADARIVLRLNSSGQPITTNSATGVEVVDANGATLSAATNALDDATNCAGGVSTAGASGKAVGTHGPGTGDSSAPQLRLYREYQHNSTINDVQRTLEVDMRALLNCMHNYPAILSGRTLDDSTQEGLVLYFAIQGPASSAAHNNYSVRLRNGSVLQSSVSGAPAVRGLTVVTDQGLVVWGNYNSASWIPSALIGDTLWLLSNGWTDSLSFQETLSDRPGTATMVQAAVLTGIRRTGNANGAAGRDQGADSSGGGVINFMRFNERFFCGSGCIPNFTYVGSIASLGAPLHSQSNWGPFTYYSAPNRVWSYDTRFNNPANLPPMTPSATYLRQELFAREYGL